MGAVALITGDRFLDDELYELVASKLVSQGPSGCFVAPHQGCVDPQGLVQRQGERHRGRLDRRVATIWITGVVGLAHSTNEIRNSSLVGERCGRGQKENIPGGNKGRRQ